MKQWVQSSLSLARSRYALCVGGAFFNLLAFEFLMFNLAIKFAVSDALMYMIHAFGRGGYDGLNVFV